MLQKTPDDPEIEEMDPMMKAWMFYSWAEDYHDEFELLKNQGYLIGSFINPAAVKQMLDGTKYTSSEEEFEEVSQKMSNESKKQLEQSESRRKRRKRKIIA